MLNKQYNLAGADSAILKYIVRNRSLLQPFERVLQNQFIIKHSTFSKLIAVNYPTFMKPGHEIIKNYVVFLTTLIPCKGDLH